MLHFLFSTKYGLSKELQADRNPFAHFQRCQPLLSFTAYGAVVSISHYTPLRCVQSGPGQLCLCRKSVSGQYEHKTKP
jgi:hypothetical protein